MTFEMLYSIANETEIFYSHTLIKRTMTAPKIIYNEPKPKPLETISELELSEGFKPLSAVKKLLRIA